MMWLVVRVVLCVSMLLTRAALADSVDSKVGVTVILRGEPMTTARFQDAVTLAKLPIDFRFTELPNAPEHPQTGTSAEAAVAAARQDYAQANLRQCLEHLAAEELVNQALKESQRELAARVLFWRTACQVGLGGLTAARVEAGRIGTLELQLPADVGRTTPEVERVLAEEVQRAGRQARVALQVDSSVPGATVALDGRSRVCVTPCALEVYPGDHLVRLEADGVLAESRTVHVEPGKPARSSIAFTAAGPEISSEQWTRKYAGSADVDSAASVRLLARAVRAQRLVLVTAESSSIDARLKGVFAEEDAVRGYAERYTVEKDFDAAALGLMEDLLIKGSVLQPPPSLVKRPVFWVVVAAVAVAAVVGTYFIVSPPPVDTRVHF
jgi:hypothetical protein